MKGQGGGGGGPQHRDHTGQGQQQPSQDHFDSWRHQQPTAPAAGFNPMSSLPSADPYGFYQHQNTAAFHHYPGFGVGEGTWSSGDHMFLPGYGGQLAGAEQQFGMDTATIFGAGGGFGAFTQPAGYGFDFHAGSAGYSQWGNAATGRAAGEQYYRPEQYTQDQDGRGRVAAAEQAMQGLNIGGSSSAAGAHQPPSEAAKEIKVGGHPEPKEINKPGLEPPTSSTSSNGTSAPPSQPKKMSWATVASQPAKPAPAAGKSKKPGVLSPPVLPGSVKPNLDIGTWDSNNKQQNGGMPPPPLMSVPPPMSSGQRQPVPLQGVPPRGGGWMGPRGPAPTARPPTGPPVPLVPVETNGSHPVLDELKSSNDYNPRGDFEPKNARFFVVKSYSEDDIHRSIKYEIWCSTEHGNKRLDLAWREREAKGGSVYLFFSVNGSGHFCGMAEMLSGVDYNSSAGVWAQDKWKGQFKVKWIYVKDVPNAQLRHIRLENNENKPVTNSRDTQEVPVDKGKQVLKILAGYKHSTSIFDDFIHYEKRQEEDEGRKQPPYQNGGGGRGDHHRRDDRRGHDSGQHNHDNRRGDEQRQHHHHDNRRVGGDDNRRGGGDDNRRGGGGGDRGDRRDNGGGDRPHRNMKQ